MPSDDVQVRALLKDEAHELVRKSLGKSQLEPGDYARVITVSFDTVVEYLLTNCRIDDIADEKESLRDGYYALPGNGCWIVYYQEKGGDCGREVVYSEEDVFSHFTKTVLHVKSSG